MKLISTFALVLLLSACSSTPPVEANKAAEYFDAKEGCFLLYNVRTKNFDKVIGEENCKKEYPACSSFKVPLAVMAFDAKALKDENVVLKWDGKKDEFREVANQDHNAKTWMSNSIVWFSQRLTKKMGTAKVQKYLDGFNYGNKDLKGGLTEAWLVRPSSPGPALKITGYDQVEFMRKLWGDELPASKRAMKLTRDITFLETSPKGFQLHGKTGSGFYDDTRKVNLGWFIGHLQNGDQEYIVVTNYRDLAPVQEIGYGGPRSKEIAKKILGDEGIW